MRDLMTLVENMSIASVLNMEHTKRALTSSLSNGGMETVRSMIRLNLGLEPYASREQPNPPNFQSLFLDWMEDAIYDSFYKISSMVRDGKIKAWRKITAGPEWTPDSQHPGLYWSWDEHAAEAHWGGADHEGSGPVTWVMEAWITADHIDWETTVVMNADPDYREEKEIRILPNAPVQIIRYWSE